MEINNNSPHFNISAAVVRQLGEELVSDEVTALMEMVKNCYDADATWAKIEINTTKQLKGKKLKSVGDNSFITIEDNGFGMNETDIRDGWLIISHSNKRKMKVKGDKTPNGRTPLGDKGLGRLSTQRLGDRIELFTSKYHDPFQYHVAFDWTDFNEETPLTSVKTFFEQLPKNKKQGTKLVITKLKDPSVWEGASGDKLKGQLTQLIFPYKEKRVFQLFLTINGDNINFDEITEALRDQAVSRFNFSLKECKLKITGSVKLYKLYGGSPSSEDKANYDNLIQRDLGLGFFSFLTDKLNNKSYFRSDIKYSSKHSTLFTFEKECNLQDIPGVILIKEDNSDEVFVANPGNFEGEIDDFNLLKTDTLNSAFDNFAGYKNIVKNQIGIRIFRDGFGIKPFGMDGNDWLKLGTAQTSGSSFYGLRPSNTIGFVSISANDNQHLKEKTDREGFVESPYSRNFFLVMDKIVDEINNLLEGTRRSYNSYKKTIAQQSGGITDIKESIERIKNSSYNAAKIHSESKALSDNLSLILKNVKSILSTKSKESLNVADVEKHMKTFIEVDKQLEKTKTFLAQIDSSQEVLKKLEYDANFIQPKVQDLEQQLFMFADLAGIGLTAESLSHELSNIVDRLLSQTKNINKQIKGKEDINTSAVFIYIEDVRSSIKALRAQLSHIGPTLKYLREIKEEINIKDYIEEIISFYKRKYENEINIESRMSGKSFIIKISRGKLTQVIDNIILNSEFWLCEKLRYEKDFKPNIIIDISEPFVRIFDNGYGIDPSIEERIFQPFVTSKPRNKGRGLGLFIVQQLLERDNCDIVLLDRKNKHNHKYMFQIDFTSIIN
jgi:signal transduction histidine kinase